MKTVRKGGSTPKSVPAPRRETTLESVRDLLASIKDQLKESKCTVGDYVRLLQLEKELEAEEPPKEIRVTWIDRVETPDSEE
ncbi:MAG TPA: hypothetical protein VHD76_21325 [Bryobacteraceae bacterium]|jgi:hypothetical protein|nr:hypothetical protein [Bryobacteraceae bacterium]